MNSNQSDHFVPQMFCNPKYFAVKRRENLVIDDRFKRIFEDKDFQSDCFFDQRGRQGEHLQVVDLKRLYGFSTTNDELKPKENKIKIEKEAKKKAEKNDTNNEKVAKNKLANNKVQEEIKGVQLSEETVRPHSVKIPLKVAKNEDEIAKEIKSRNFSSVAFVSKETNEEIHKKVKKPKKITSKELEEYKKRLKEILGKDKKIIKKTEDVHKEFTWTVTGPDVPESEEESPDEDGIETGMKKKRRKNGDGDEETKVEMSESEKTELELLVMDESNVKKMMNNKSNPPKEKLTRKEIKKIVKDKFSGDNEFKKKALVDPRFLSLKSDLMFAINPIVVETIQKRKQKKEASKYL